MRRFGLIAGAITLGLSQTSLAVAQMVESPLLADSFRLGSGGGVLCRMQTRGRDAAIKDIYDRAWYIVCRDAARPVGKIFALRGEKMAALERLSANRATDASCANATKDSLKVDDIGTVSVERCKLVDAPVGYNVIQAGRGKTLWVAEGLAGYESALTLGLRTVMQDKIVPGQVSVAITSIDDPVAFARVQAGTLDPDQALAEGYRRNNSGNYAEAAEFFGTLQQRTETEARSAERNGEYVVNLALQKSNLGDFGEAEALFANVRRTPTVDRIQTRLRRNFEAMHLLNQQRYDEAIARLEQPVAPIGDELNMPGSAIEIGPQVAAEINSGLPVGQRLGATEVTALTPEERAKFLDAQALQLRGTLYRLKGNPAEAQKALEKALADVVAVREGRVLSVIRLRGQIMMEDALAIEDGGNVAGAEARFREALALLEQRYPQTVAVNGARARLAAFLARHGKSAEAMTEYRAVVAAVSENRVASAGLGNLLGPYFALLAEQIPANPALVEDMFIASQTMIRPGVADTQAILSRELSEGNGEAARLFRQALTLERDAERGRIELATLIATQQKTPEIEQAIASIRQDIDEFTRDQAATQAKLAEYPQFRAISTSIVPLKDLKAALKPGEAYYKTTVVGKAIYAVFVDGAGASGYRIPISSDQLDRAVDKLRDSVIKEVDGQQVTYPFDAKLANNLYNALFGPVSGRLTASTHLIYEPDGAMLRLPVSLLVTSRAGVDAYQARQKLADADEYDFRGIDWLARKRAVSTALSVRGFRDARNTPASNASRQYLGLGQNAPIKTAVAGRRATAQDADCSWPNEQWGNPISAAELREAQKIIGADRSVVIIDEAFTDSDLMQRKDLADFRILHFATHGLVTAPRPECPARPALVTSFGDANSDGLLSFREIYDLRLNADLVILSACDTAGRASIAATREAGVTTGGGSALDGLVRAFIGAGGRSVIASHWPAPDQFDATERLITGLFENRAEGTVGRAFADAQLALMDDVETSHPFYWSGFAIIGDGAQPLLNSSGSTASSAGH